MVINLTEPQTASPVKKRVHLLWQLLAALAIGGLLGAGVNRLIPHTYTATTVLQFPASTAQGSGSSDKPSLPLMQGVISVPQPGTSPATAVYILTSHRMTEQLIAHNHIRPDGLFDLLRAIDTDTYFRGKFQCIAGGAGELRIAYTDRVPQRAQQIVREAITQLTHTVDELSLDPAARTVKFLANNLHESEQACVTAEAAVVDFLRLHDGTPPDMRLQALNQLHTDLRHELRVAEVDEAAARARVQTSTRLYTQMLASLHSTTGNTLLETLYRAVVDRENELAVLRQKYTDQRPEVVQARQVRDVARHSLQEEISRQLRGLRTGASPYVHDDLVTAIANQAKIEGLRRATADLSASIAQLPAAQTHYEQLQLTLKDARTRLSLVRGEFVRAQIIAQSHGPQFVVLDPPTIPRRPNEPPPWQCILTGALLCAILVLCYGSISWTQAFMKKIGL